MSVKEPVNSENADAQQYSVQRLADRIRQVYQEPTTIPAMLTLLSGVQRLAE